MARTRGDLEYNAVVTDEDGRKHYTMVAPWILGDSEELMKHVSLMNEWTHSMMEKACDGERMSDDWYAGEMPNSYYILSIHEV